MRMREEYRIPNGEFETWEVVGRKSKKRIISYSLPLRIKTRSVTGEGRK
jgi:hypothetical protein